MIFKASTRALVSDAEPFWAPKLAVRMLTLSMTIAAIATFLSGLPHTFDIWQLIFPLVVSLKWNVAVIAVRLSRIRPMHPAAVLVLDMLLWGFLVVFTALAVLQGATLAEAAQQGDTGTGDPNLDSLLTKNPDAAIASPIILAASGFAGAAFVGHFVLFVWAGVDWHTRRKREIRSMAPGARVKNFQGWDWAQSPREGSQVALMRENSAATKHPGGWYAASERAGSNAGMPSAYPDEPRFVPVQLEDGTHPGAQMAGWPMPPPQQPYIPQLQQHQQLASPDSGINAAGSPLPRTEPLLVKRPSPEMRADKEAVEEFDGGPQYARTLVRANTLESNGTPGAAAAIASAAAAGGSPRVATPAQQPLQMPRTARVATPHAAPQPPPSQPPPQTPGTAGIVSPGAMLGSTRERRNTASVEGNKF